MHPTDILLVEDNPDDVELTIRAFEDVDLTNKIVTVRDGAEALEYLLGTEDDPDSREDLPALVLLDLNLPRVSGLEVLKRIRADDRTKHVPVVILTTSDDESDIVNGYEFGTNSYVRKPINFDAFVRSVKSLGLYWLVQNIPPVR